MNDLKKKDVAEMVKTLADKREALRTFRFGAEGSRSRNVREGRTIRKEIAQLLTELRVREIDSQKKTA
ncbi:MAG: 50S ribosomal protein L29 [Candidatus Paceibacterota bacterium]